MSCSSSEREQTCPNVPGSISHVSDKHVLVTGGLGFIGSHTAIALVEAGARVSIVDDLSNSFLEVLERMKTVLGERFDRITFHKVSVLDKDALSKVFKDGKFDAVVHFAAFKAVGESMDRPLDYYHNNIGGSMSLLQCMKAAGVNTLVFSSSCTVYGVPERVPMDEECRLQAISPYGRTKLYIEELLRDMARADDAWDFVILRYFNPVAAHPSGELGEHPVGVPQNLMPFVQQVATGQRPELKVFGNDYNTRDGTCVRDYIHIMDLADAHVAALRRALDTNKPRLSCVNINVGTGTGSTVLEMVAAMEKASGRKIPYSVAPRRAGDTEAVWAATEFAEREMGWKAKYDVEDMCRDQWRWAEKYPKGFE